MHAWMQANRRSLPRRSQEWCCIIRRCALSSTSAAAWLTSIASQIRRTFSRRQSSVLSSGCGGNRLPKRIHLVAGARPNFMKIAPLFHSLSRADWAEPVIIHTGQHHDRLMSDVFLEDLGLPAPHVNLAVGSGTHAETTAAVMVAYEKLCQTEVPDFVVVVGDVNSTVAAALVAKKLV